MKQKEVNERQSKKVWRIFHFEDRFEMKEYRRQGGLDFVRMFVTSTTREISNESSSFMQQLTELEHYYPDDRDALEGRFWRLCRLTATKEDWLRGYLLDSDNEPLTASKIAARLHLSLAAMKKTLVGLKKVGLIEYADMPELKVSKREKSDNSENEKDDVKKGKLNSKKTRNTREKAAQNDDLETFGNVSESLYNSNNNRNGIEIINQTKNKIEFETEEQTNSSDSDRGQQEARDNGTVTEPPTTPTTTPSIRPNSSTKTDGTGKDGKRVNAPYQSVDTPGVNIVNIALHRYSKASNEFALAMMYELGVITIADMQRIYDGDTRLTREQAKERGNWSVAYQKAELIFDSSVLEELKKELMKRVPKALGKDNPAAFLRTCWENLCIDYKRKQARASPACM